MAVSHKFINQALKRYHKGESVKKLERELKTGFIHKIFKFIRLDNGQMPKTVTETDFLIAMGQLKKEEKEYYRKSQQFKKGQKKLTQYC